MHNSAPFPKAGSVHGEYLVGHRQSVDPTFKFGRFPRILPPCPFNPRLYLTQRHSGKEQIRLFHGSEPCDHGSVRTRLSKL